MGKLCPDSSLFHILENFFLRIQIVFDSIVIISLFLFPFFQTLGSLVWSGHKYVLFGWQGRSPRSIHRALWQGTIHNWGLKIYVRTIYLNYFVILVNSHYLVNYKTFKHSHTLRFFFDNIITNSQNRLLYIFNLKRKPVKHGFGLICFQFNCFWRKCWLFDEIFEKDCLSLF